jgi:hypothetical protein
LKIPDKTCEVTNEYASKINSAYRHARDIGVDFVAAGYFPREEQENLC